MTSTVPHQALYRRWRAQTFAEMVGQEAVVETLRNAVRSGRVGHAILFVGPRGTGKTSLARILAKAVNCTDRRDGDACNACPSCVSIREGTTLDLIEIDAATNNGIEEVRRLRERLPYPPGELKRKIYILDEAHQITGPAWNALLKSIEEPPEFVIFMFASTEPSRFPPAILSRLQRFDVRRLTVPEIEGKLTRILAADAREADDSAVRLIARLAAGGMRDAESMLDQLLSAAPERIDEAHVRDLLGLADAEVVDAFVDLLIRGEAAAGVALLDSLDERGRDVRALLDQVVEAIRLELVAGLTEPGRARHDPAALAAAGRRIAAIDPNRAGIGGLRFQLELALFNAATTGQVVSGLAPTIATEAAAAKPSAGRPTMKDPPGDVIPAARPAPATQRAAATGQPPSTEQPTTIEQPPEAEQPPATEPLPAASKPQAERPSTERPSTEPPAAVTEPRSTEQPRAAARASASSNGDQSAAATGPRPGTDPRPAIQPATRTQPDPAPPAPDASAPAASAALEELLAAWPAIVSQLSAHPPTKPLVIACRPVTVDGAIVTLGFPEEQAFLKDAAERRRPAIEAGISSVLGRPVTVRCVVANVEIAVAAPADSAYVLAEARRIFADDIVDVGEIS